jgi:hypothetical protein
MARQWHGWQYEDGFRLPATTPDEPQARPALDD